MASNREVSLIVGNIAGLTYLQIDIITTPPDTTYGNFQEEHYSWKLEDVNILYRPLPDNVVGGSFSLTNSIDRINLGFTWEEVVNPITVDEATLYSTLQNLLMVPTETLTTVNIAGPLDVNIVSPNPVPVTFSAGVVSRYRNSVNATPVNINPDPGGGNLFRFQATNSNSIEKYIKLYASAVSPTVGVDIPIYTIAVPRNIQNGGHIIEEFAEPITYGLPLWAACVNGQADSSNTFTGTDLIIHAQYN